MRILISGGTGYIGSHTCVALMQGGHEVVIIDNLCNSERSVVDRIGSIVGHVPGFYEGDVRDSTLLQHILRTHDIESVIHFAGLKAVGESVSDPLRYYECNVGGALSLFDSMAAAKIRKLIFSSSATVYGDPDLVPIKEGFPTKPTSPYGRSKLMVEDILADLYAADPAWTIVRLRYFNPVGAHESGLIGESPNGTPNNLMPYIAQVAQGDLEKLNVFGNDYLTRDGTGVRDYLHVVDLAEGHVAAVNRLLGNSGMFTLNLGTGQGYSVMEVLSAFEHISGKTIPYVVTARRPGDIAECWADPSEAERLLGWKARRNLEAMCRDVWRWQTRCP